MTQLHETQQRYLNAKAMCEEAHRMKHEMLLPYDYLFDGEQTTEVNIEHGILVETTADQLSHAPEAEMALRKAGDALIEWGFAQIEANAQKAKTAIGIETLEFLKANQTKLVVRNKLIELFSIMEVTVAK